MTEAVEHGAQMVLEAIRHVKHLVLLNTELDGTAGSILKVYADRARQKNIITLSTFLASKRPTKWPAATGKLTC